MPIPGLVPIISSAPGGPVEVTQTAVDKSTSNSSSYLFSSQSLGALPEFNQERIIIIATGGLATVTGVTTSAVSISGNGATKIVEAASNFDTAALWAVSLQALTSGNVSITFTNTMNRVYCVTYRMIGASGLTPHDTATDVVTSGALNTTIDCPANGAIVGTSFMRRTTSASVATTAWTNLTEDVDDVVESNASNFSSAHDEFVTLQTNRSITATNSGSGSSVDGRLALASWGPA